MLQPQSLVRTVGEGVRLGLASGGQGENLSLCSWLVEGTGGKGSSAGLLPGSIEAQTHV